MLDSQATPASRESTTTLGVWLLAGLPLAYVFVATNMAALPFFTTWHDQQRILEVVLLGGVAVLLTASSSARTEWIAAFTAIPVTGRALIAGFFLLGAISTVRAALLGPALRELSLFLLLAVLAVGVAAARARIGPRFDRIAIVVLVAAAIIYTFVFIGLRLAGIPPFQYRVGTYGAMYGFSNPRFFGQYAVWILPLLFAAPLADNDERAARGILLAAAIGWAALLIESGGRAPIAAVPAALIAVVILLRRASLPWARVAAIGMAGGAALWFAVVQVASVLRGGGITLTPAVQAAIDRGPVDRTYRPVFFREAWEMIVANPLLGVGPEHFAYYRVESSAAGVHNAPLQLAAEWGPPATALLLAAAVWGLLVWSRHTRLLSAAGEADKVVVRTALLASVAAAGFLSLFDGVIVMPVSQVLLALVVGWMLGIHAHPRLDSPISEARTGSTSAWRFAVPGVALAATVALVWTASPYLFQPRVELERRVDGVVEQGESVLLPRFWIEGRLPEY